LACRSPAIGVLVAVDAVREVQLGTAHALTWFQTVAAYVGLAAAVAVGRWPERRRMALWIMAWLLTGAVIDLAWDWPDSRLAYTLLLLALALQAPVYAQMALAYPSGRVRERLERAFLIVAYTVSLAWELTPALFFDPRGCTNCGQSAPSLLFTGHTFDLTPLGRVYWSLFIALGVAFIALVIRRLLVSPRGALRTMLPLAAAAFFAGAELIVERIAWLTGWDQALGTLDWLDSANGLIVPRRSFPGSRRSAGTAARSATWSSNSHRRVPGRSRRRSRARSGTRHCSSRSGYRTTSSSSTSTGW
jgi:hypothetical protein